MNITTVRDTRPDKVRDFITHCCGTADIVPLDSMSAPLVHEMQTAIRRQQQLLNDAATAIQYLLGREHQFRKDMFATESEARLTTVLAEILRVPRAHVAAEYDCYHAKRDKEEAA
jgi:hypothetical protein